MKKKVLILSLAIALVAITAIGLTLAYFTSDADTVNTFTVGNVEIELTEPAWNVEGAESDDVYPGEALPKDPTVTNIGANPCLVRVKVEMPGDGEDGVEALAGMISFETNYVKNALGADWIDGGDGYYYYMKPLAVGESTSALFDQIRFSFDLEAIPEQPQEGYGVHVFAEAVQAQGVFPSYSAYTDGIDPTEFAAIQAFFTAAGF